MGERLQRGQCDIHDTLEVVRLPSPSKAATVRFCDVRLEDMDNVLDQEVHE